MSQSSKPTIQTRGGSMFEKQVEKLQELAKNRVRELNISEEDKIRRVRIYKNKQGKITMKEIDSIPFSKCLFKHISPLNTLLEVQIDQKLFQLSKEQSAADVLCNRLKLEQSLQKVRFNNEDFYPVGATGSLKEGTLWFAVEKTRDIIHRFFNYSESASTYLGILMSQGFFGEFKCNTVTVYQDASENDGMGYIRSSYAQKLNLNSQCQIRIVDIDNHSGAKGTLLPIDDQEFTEKYGHMDIAINHTLIKTESKVFNNCIVSVRAVAKFRPMKSSFQVLQFINNEGLGKLLPSVDKTLDEIFSRFTDKSKAVEAMKLRLIEEEDYLFADTKLAMLLLSNKVDFEHPWIQNRLLSLWVKELSELSTGGAFRFYSGMAAFDASIPKGKVKLSNGSVFMNMGDLRDLLLGDCDGDLLGFSIDRKNRKAVVLRYPLIQSASVMSLDIIGDIPDSLESHPETVDILSNYVQRLTPIVNPETTKKRTDLSRLVSVLLDGAAGGGIGCSTLALSAAQAHSQYDLVYALGVHSQVEVLRFKHIVRHNSVVAPNKVLKELGSPAWFGINHEKLREFQPIEYEGIVTKCYNHVVNRIQEFTAKFEERKRPLTDFRAIVPLPSFTRREFIKIYNLYKNYCRAIVNAVENDNEERLNAIIKHTENLGMAMSETDVALAWHIAHINPKGLGAFPIHLGINQLLKILGVDIDTSFIRIVKESDCDNHSVYEKHISLCIKRLLAA